MGGGAGGRFPLYPPVGYAYVMGVVAVMQETSKKPIIMSGCKKMEEIYHLVKMI